MKSITVWFASTLGLLLTQIVPMALAQPCLEFYTTTEDGTVLTKVNRKNGDTTNVPLTEGRIYSLAYDTESGTLFGLLDGTKLVTIDEGTGFVTVVGETGQTDLMGFDVSRWGEMIAFSNTDGCLYFFMLDEMEATPFFCAEWTDIVGLTIVHENMIYLTDGKELFALDAWTNETESLGKVSGLNNGARLAGLAATPNGKLYGISNDRSRAGIYGIGEYTVTAMSDGSGESSLSDRVFQVANRNARSELTNSRPAGGTVACKFSREKVHKPSRVPSMQPVVPDDE